MERKLFLCIQEKSITSKEKDRKEKIFQYRRNTNTKQIQLKNRYNHSTNNTRNDKKEYKRNGEKVVSVYSVQISHFKRKGQRRKDILIQNKYKYKKEKNEYKRKREKVVGVYSVQISHFKRKRSKRKYITIQKKYKYQLVKYIEK